MTLWRVLIAAAAAAMLLGTPLPHIDSDAALFGKIAKTIVDTGEWLTLRHPVHPDWVVDKPPLTFWLMALSLRVGGQTDAALRLWHILLSLALVWAVYRLARIDGTEEEALLAALLLATFQQVFYSSMAPQHDVPVTLFLTLAFLASARYARDGRGRWPLLAALWTALAVLTKGVLWLPVVAGIAGADWLAARWTGQRPPWRPVHLAAAAALFLAVASPWFVVGALRQGPPFVRVFLFDENGIARLEHAFLGGGLVPLHSFLLMVPAYVPLLLVGMLPWTGLLPGALGKAWRGLRAGPPTVRLSALWFGLFFLAVSLSHGDRIIRYLLPCYPPLAVLAGRFLVAALDGRARIGRASALLPPLLGVPLLGTALWLARRMSPVEMRFYTPLILPTLVVFAAALLAFAVLALRGRLRQAVALTVAGSLLSYTLAYAMLMARWDRLWPWPAIAAAVNRLYRPGDRVMVVGVNPAETNFAAYWIHAPVEQVDEQTFLSAWDRGRVFALLPPGVRPLPRATVLLRTPLGWTLVTNRPTTSGPTSVPRAGRTRGSGPAGKD
jgi:4-amino-4-deoxy-L-arabinose transferase-like glycosyltransferase